MRLQRRPQAIRLPRRSETARDAYIVSEEDAGVIFRVSRKTIHEITRNSAKLFGVVSCEFVDRLADSRRGAHVNLKT